MAEKPSSKARKKAAPEADEGPSLSLLPLPGPLLTHHLVRLAPLLRSWRETGKVPPVLLITGSSGVGKREMATWLAQTLFCERAGFSKSTSTDEGFGFIDAPVEPGEPLACGNCNACLKALHGTGVDFQSIQAESEDGDPGTLKIEQFRALKATQGFGAFDGGYRITLIGDADQMTVQAANSLLKLLEEPPPGWILLLTASDPTLLLPTLVSRCQRIRLEPLPPETLRALLEAGDYALIAPERRAVAAQLASGSWGQAKRILEPSFWERRESFFRFLEEPSLEAGGWIDAAATDPRTCTHLLDQLESALADLVSWAASGEVPENYPWQNRDGARTLARVANRLTRKQGSRAGATKVWVEHTEQLFRTRNFLQAPLNRKLLLQELLLPFLQDAR